MGCCQPQETTRPSYSYWDLAKKTWPERAGKGTALKSGRALGVVGTHWVPTLSRVKIGSFLWTVFVSCGKGGDPEPYAPGRRHLRVFAHGAGGSQPPRRGAAVQGHRLLRLASLVGPKPAAEEEEAHTLRSLGPKEPQVALFLFLQELGGSNNKKTGGQKSNRGPWQAFFKI